MIAAFRCGEPSLEKATFEDTLPNDLVTANLVPYLILVDEQSGLLSFVAKDIVVLAPSRVAAFGFGETSMEKATFETMLVDILRLLVTAVSVPRLLLVDELLISSSFAATAVVVVALRAVAVIGFGGASLQRVTGEDIVVVDLVALSPFLVTAVFVPQLLLLLDELFALSSSAVTAVVVVSFGGGGRHFVQLLVVSRRKQPPLSHLTTASLPSEEHDSMVPQHQSEVSSFAYFHSTWMRFPIIETMEVSLELEQLLVLLFLRMLFMSMFSPLLMVL